MSTTAILCTCGCLLIRARCAGRPRPSPAPRRRRGGGHQARRQHVLLRREAVGSGPDAAVVEPDPALPRLDPEPVLRAADPCLVQRHVCHHRERATLAEAPDAAPSPSMGHARAITYVNRRKKSSPDAGTTYFLNLGTEITHSYKVREPNMNITLSKIN